MPSSAAKTGAAQDKKNEFRLEDHGLQAVLRFDGNRAILDYKLQSSVVESHGLKLMLRVNHGTPMTLSSAGGSIVLPDLGSGEHLAVLQLVKPDGTALRMGDHRWIFSFEKTGSGFREIPRRSAYLWVLTPKGTVVKDQDASIAFDFVFLATKNEKIRYRLRGESRELLREGPYTFKGLPPASYELQVFIVDAQGTSVSEQWSQDSTIFDLR